MQSKSTQPAGQAGGAPAAPGAQVPGTVPTAPRTTAEYMVLDARRRELLDQLSANESRVRRLTEQITGVADEAKPPLVERLTQLSGRTMQIEADLAAVETQLANVPASVAQTLVPPRRDVLGSGQITAISIVTVICVLMPIAIAVARLIWRRAFVRVPSAADAEGAQRLRRMEHAVDAMAIEVERISEGQRFLTQLFAQKKQPELPAENKLT